MSTNRITDLMVQLDLIESYTSPADVENQKVSRRSKYWQLDHALIVMEMVGNSLLHSNFEDYRPKFSFLKSAIMTTGYMPRGKARAPKQVLNGAPITQQSLLDKIKKVRAVLNKLSSSNSEQCFKHPMFGYMNKEDTLKFMRIHTHHHLKIVKDILRIA
ncbi:MAG: DUF1569 domain-containing protein [Nonlabens sp.]